MEGIELLYLVCSISLLTSTKSFHMMPLGSRLAPPWGHKFEHRNKRRQNSKFFFSEPGRSRALIFRSTGHRPASLYHGPLSVVRLSVRPLFFSLNIFFSETTYQILMKFHQKCSCHGPLQNFLK